MKDPTDTRDIGPRVGSPLWIHITVVSVVGAAVFGLALSRLMDLSTLIDHPLFWVLAVMVVLGEIWPIVTPGHSRLEAPLASVTVPLMLPRPCASSSRGAQMHTAYAAAKQPIILRRDLMVSLLNLRDLQLDRSGLSKTKTDTAGRAYL